MALAAISDRFRVWGLVSNHVWRSAKAWFRGGILHRWRFSVAGSDQLVIAPQDIRTSDPTIAADIYAGIYTFSGQVVETEGLSPFEFNPPSRQWAGELHSFGWLRHLRAADSLVSKANARALIDDWIRTCGRSHDIAWEPEITARRVLSWMAQSPILLAGCDHEFYRRFMRMLVRQTNFLRRTINEAPEGVPRLRIAVAVVAAAVSISGQNRFLRQATRRLDQEITRQILADGGHISRNPGAILNILTDLLPVRQAIIAHGSSPSDILMGAVDRMMPMIRFFRHGDGSFAQFNGMGGTPSDQLATVLAYDDARGMPPDNASHSGYQRIVCGPTLVLMDAGPAPPTPVSADAHAGCLSFEMSSGGERLIVNCGVPAFFHPNWRQVARSTAAHSTLVLNDTSSCRFLTEERHRNILGALILSGPSGVDVRRSEDDQGIVVTARHDGYMGRIGYMHERVLGLTPNGETLAGIDRLIPGRLKRASGKDQTAVRFHLHPTVQTSQARSGNVLLVTPKKTVWEFSAQGADVEIEESIYFSDVHGHRRTSQIVLHTRPKSSLEIVWKFQRIDGETPSTQDLSDVQHLDLGELDL